MNHLKLLLLLLLGSIATDALAQRTGSDRPFRAWIETQAGEKIGPGYVQEFAPSSVVLVADPAMPSTAETIAATNIASLQFRKEGRLGRGMIFGAIAGFVGGGLIVYATAKEDQNCFLCFSREEQALTGATLSLPIGFLLGAAISSAKATYPIGGSQRAYEKFQVHLARYRLE